MGSAVTLIACGFFDAFVEKTTSATSWMSSPHPSSLFDAVFALESPFFSLDHLFRLLYLLDHSRLSVHLASSFHHLFFTWVCDSVFFLCSSCAFHLSSSLHSQTRSSRSSSFSGVSHYCASCIAKNLHLHLLSSKTRLDPKQQCFL